MHACYVSDEIFQVEFNRESKILSESQMTFYVIDASSFGPSYCHIVYIGLLSTLLHMNLKF